MEKEVKATNEKGKKIGQEGEREEISWIRTKKQKKEKREKRPKETTLKIKDPFSLPSPSLAKFVRILFVTFLSPVVHVNTSSVKNWKKLASPQVQSNVTRTRPELTEPGPLLLRASSRMIQKNHSFCPRLPNSGVGGNSTSSIFGYLMGHPYYFSIPIFT